MYYRHNLNYEYPEQSDQHMIKVKRVRKTHFDADYEYWNRSLGFKLLRSVYWVLVTGIVFPLMRLTHGLRIEGKENLKKHKDTLAGERSPSPTTCFIGIISVC